MRHCGVCNRCLSLAFFICIFILFFLLLWLTKPWGLSTWPEISFRFEKYGLSPPQQSKHVWHNHMRRTTDFPITNVHIWSGVLGYYGVYLHTQTTSICMGSLRVCVGCSVHFWVLHNNLWFVRCDFPLWLSKTLTDRRYQPNWDSLRFGSDSLCGCAILRFWFGVCFNFNCLFYLSDWQAMHIDELNWKLQR